MSARRTVARIAALGAAPLALTMLSAVPAGAHGSMTDPVSRVSTCFAEGPENPRSAACKAAVQASGTQAFYDWNEVNIPDAAGRHKEIIPDGKLCSAGRDKYKGLDLPRTDWPASRMSAGTHTFSYQATAPHKGSFELYITKSGYDASEPLKWSDLESKPFAKITDPQLQGGAYTFEGKVPQRSGRHLIFSVWQRSDSPEAFYTCSDVTFGGGKAGGPGGGTPTASSTQAATVPDSGQVSEGFEKSTVENEGRGGGHSGAHGHGAHEEGAGSPESSTSRPAAPAPKTQLADTGAETHTGTIAAAGGSVLLLGGALMLAGLRRRAAGRGRS
ncbi:chitin-binding protein [Streptomyces daqingensis]|uniref:Chitin-binding protein n=1 Tax=Streptomyces daqingensis TaxID=1472640 RepID=A0ABQ2LYK1_9ACTN|nr:lytic polysaccharide monooxygenase [Streptomyces daqingensis]GGO44666.1 chitin-binding protein [Streptomyces daqingensis]